MTIGQFLHVEKSRDSLQGSSTVSSLQHIMRAHSPPRFSGICCHGIVCVPSRPFQEVFSKGMTFYQDEVHLRPRSDGLRPSSSSSSCFTDMPVARPFHPSFPTAGSQSDSFCDLHNLKRIFSAATCDVVGNISTRASRSIFVPHDEQAKRPRTVR